MLDDHSRTDVSLLRRVSLEIRDERAWSDFVDRYAPKVYGWCRAWKLQESDAQDVTQVVLLKLARRMEQFRYDPSQSFRGWLWTLTEHAWKDWRDDRRRLGAAVGGDEVLACLERVEAREDLAHRLEQEYDLELLDEAIRRVRSQVAPSTWEAYRLTAIEKLSGSDAADRLGLSVAAVFKAKSAVMKRLQDEVRTLEGPLTASNSHD